MSDVKKCPACGKSSFPWEKPATPPPAQGDAPQGQHSAFTREAVFANMLRNWSPEDCRSFYEMLSRRPDFNAAPQGQDVRGALDNLEKWFKWFRPGLADSHARDACLRNIETLRRALAPPPAAPGTREVGGKGETVLAVLWEWGPGTGHEGARFWGCHGKDKDGRYSEWPKMGLRALGASKVTVTDGEGLDLIPLPEPEQPAPPTQQGDDVKKWNLGKGIRQVRRLRGWTQTELAEKTNLSPSWISHYESGRRSPSLENFRRLVIALRTSADALLGLQLSPAQPNPQSKEK